MAMRVFLLLVLVFFVLGCSSTPERKRDLTKAKYYTVQSGDTLYAIGFRTGYGYKKVAAWNSIRSPYKLSVGKKLRLFSTYKKKTTWKKATKWKKPTKKAKPKKKWQSSKLNKLRWQWPVKGKILRGFYATDKKGIDIAGKVGRRIKAAESGVVVYSGSSLVGYGRLLIIKHNYLYLSAYGQNRRLLVKEGQKVKRGQVIAEMGVGVNAKPLLHFEIRRNGDPLNPMKYLPKK